jgi:hypothetical protein
MQLTVVWSRLLVHHSEEIGVSMADQHHLANSPLAVSDVAEQKASHRNDHMARSGPIIQPPEGY